MFRAYSSRPIGQGQLCFAVRDSKVDPDPVPKPSPLLSYDDAVVFSTAGDVQVEFVEAAAGIPRYELRFTSPSATVNDYHRTLAAVFFDLHEDAVPGSGFELVIDPWDTEFLDENGYPIDFDVTPAELLVRAEAEPYSIMADRSSSSWKTIESTSPPPRAESRDVLRPGSRRRTGPSRPVQGC